MAKTLIAGTLALLSHCGGPALDATLAKPPPSIPCTVGPIVLEEGDTLTDGTARRILVLNRTGQANCGWKKPGSGG